MRRALLLVAVVGISLTACGSSSKSAGTTATTTTTTAPPAADLTTTTVNSAGTTVPGTSGVAGTTIPSAPETTIATVVKESAYIDSVDLNAHTITIDPMEFLTGSAATTEFHKANPGATGGPDNDYYIVNPTKDHVVLPLESTAPVRLVLVNGVLHTDPVAVAQSKLATYSQLTRAPFWVTVERGHITEVIEQFVP